MATAKRKFRVLVTGSGDKIFDYISQTLPHSSYDPILRAEDAGEARRLLLDSPVDIVIINTPLSDDFGVELALDLAEGSTGVLLLVKAELVETVCARVCVNLQAMRKWAMQYAVNIEILSPESLREEVCEDVLAAANNYSVSIGKPSPF